VGGLLFPGTAEDYGSEVTGQAEARCLQAIEGLRHGGKETLALGLFKECEGAGERDAEALSFASRSPLVKQENRAAGICELDGLALAGAQVAG